MKELIKNIKHLLEERGMKNIVTEGTEEKNRVILKAKTSNDEPVLVYVWDPEDSVGVQDARELEKFFSRNKAVKKFLIGGSKFTRMARIELEECDIEYIPTELVMLNILQHKLVPKHRILSDNEAKEILEKYQIDKTQLPSMLLSDPVAKIIGAKEGDIIEIKRDSQTSGSYLAYRHVVKELDIE